MVEDNCCGLFQQTELAHCQDPDNKYDMGKKRSESLFSDSSEESSF